MATSYQSVLQDGERRMRERFPSPTASGAISFMREPSPASAQHFTRAGGAGNVISHGIPSAHTGACPRSGRRTSFSETRSIFAPVFAATPLAATRMLAAPSAPKPVAFRETSEITAAPVSVAPTVSDTSPSVISRPSA